MNTLVDNIISFHVKPEQLNISKKEFLSKLDQMGCPEGTRMPNDDRVYIKIPAKSRRFGVNRDVTEFKQQLSNFIKKHVNAFDKIQWKN